ncbi:MAG: tetratricopeptide repeat protein [Magnetococcales bacterium]|nr:tetratricopeptide repeat protein [Magnetococcales bacterium]
MRTFGRLPVVLAFSVLLSPGIAGVRAASDPERKEASETVAPETAEQAKLKRRAALLQRLTRVPPRDREGMERVKRVLDAVRGGEMELAERLLEQIEALYTTLEAQAPGDVLNFLLADMAARDGERKRQRQELAAAVPLLRKALELAPPWAVKERVSHLVGLGKALRELGRFTEAGKTLDEARQLAESRLSSENPLMADLLDAQGALLIDLDRPDTATTAEPLLRRALVLREGEPEPIPLLVARSVARLARLRLWQRQFDVAEELARRALRIRLDQLAPNDLEVAKSLFDLGVVRRMRGEFATAEPLLEQALAIQEEGLDTPHLDIAATLHARAAMAQQSGRLDDAERFLQRALGLCRQYGGTDYPLTGVVLQDLGLLYLERKSPTEAEKYLRQALLHVERVYGPEHPRLNAIVDPLAELYRSQGRDAEAEAYLRKSFSVAEHKLGAHHNQVADRHLRLGRHYRETGRLAEAEHHYRKGLEIQRENDPSGTRDTRWLREYATLLRDMKRPLHARMIDNLIDSIVTGGPQATTMPSVRVEGP